MRTHRWFSAAAVIGILMGLGALVLPLVRAEDAGSADHHGWISTESVKTRFGDFEFKNG